MSIAILTAADTPSGGLPREVLSQLVQRAALAGKTVAVRHCRNAADAAQALRHCRRCGSEFVLLDPRHCDGSDGAGLPCIVVNPDPSRPAEASSRRGACASGARPRWCTRWRTIPRSTRGTYCSASARRQPANTACDLGMCACALHRLD